MWKSRVVSVGVGPKECIFDRRNSEDEGDLLFVFETEKIQHFFLFSDLTNDFDPSPITRYR